MYDLKTKPNNNEVVAFINSLEDPTQQSDCHQLVEIFKRVTPLTPTMWGNAMIGYGTYHYKYASGHEGDYFRVGFAPRKGSITIYLISGIESIKPLLVNLGKHKTAKSCLYIKRLADINENILADIIKLSLKKMNESYPES